MGKKSSKKKANHSLQAEMVRPAKDFKGDCPGWVSSAPEQIQCNNNSFGTVGDIGNKILQIINKCIEFVVKNKNDFVKSVKDFVLNRKLTLKIMLFILITMGTSGIQKELGKFFEQSPKTPTKGAFTRAMNRLKPDALYRLFRMINAEIETAGLALKTYRKFRLFAIDSSSLNVCKNSAEKLTLSKDGKYNQTNVHAILDIINGFFIDAIVMNKNILPERVAAEIMLSRNIELAKTALVLEDRGYISLNHLAFLLTNKFAFCIRSKDMTSEKCWLKEYDHLFEPYMKNGEFDVVLTLRVFSDPKAESEEDGLFINNPKYKYCENFQYCGENGYFEMNLRIIRHMLSSGIPEILVSNVSPSVISHEETKTIYYFRWFEEGEFRHLKYFCHAICLHHTVADRYVNEIFGRLIMANFTSICVANSLSVEGNICATDLPTNNDTEQSGPADCFKERAIEECNSLLDSGLSYGIKADENVEKDRSDDDHCADCGNADKLVPQSSTKVTAAPCLKVDSGIGDLLSCSLKSSPDMLMISMNADVSSIYMLRGNENVRIFKLNYSILCDALYCATRKNGRRFRLQEPAETPEDFVVYAARFRTRIGRDRPPEQIPERGKSRITYFPPLAYRP